MKTKSSVLIVDDDPGLSRTLSDILGAKGYAPVVADNGKTALERSYPLPVLTGATETLVR